MSTLVDKRILLWLENSRFPEDEQVRREVLQLLDASYQVTIICQRAEQQSWHEDYRGAQVYRYPAFVTTRGLGVSTLGHSCSLLAAFALSLVILCYEGFDLIYPAGQLGWGTRIAVFYRWLGKKIVWEPPTPRLVRQLALSTPAEQALAYPILPASAYWVFPQRDPTSVTIAADQLEMESGDLPTECILLGPENSGTE